MNLNEWKKEWTDRMDKWMIMDGLMIKSPMPKFGQLANYSDEWMNKWMEWWMNKRLKGINICVPIITGDPYSTKCCKISCAFPSTSEPEDTWIILQLIWDILTQEFRNCDCHGLLISQGFIYSVLLSWRPLIHQPNTCIQYRAFSLKFISDVSP